jgi:hypothetical protein
MENEIIPGERIQQAIHVIRGKNVMLDRYLALLYAIPTKALKQAVRRNPGEISGGLHESFFHTCLRRARQIRGLTGSSLPIGCREHSWKCTYKPAILSAKTGAGLSSTSKAKRSS